MVERFWYEVEEIHLRCNEVNIVNILGLVCGPVCKREAIRLKKRKEKDRAKQKIILFEQKLRQSS